MSTRRFFEEVREEVWNAVITQMAKEYGYKIDLTKVNLVNTDFTCQRKPEKLPLGALENIRKETKERLSSLK